MIPKLKDAARDMAAMMKAQGAHEPDWRPLEKVLPLKWCAGFMFMGYDGDIRIYKHGFTRRHLHVDAQGRTYRYSSSSGYARIPRDDAIRSAFDGLKEMRISRSAPYDDNAKRKRHNQLVKQGWTMVGVDISPSDEPFVLE